MTPTAHGVSTPANTPVPSPSRGGERRKKSTRPAFTLIEVVLAIGLTATVVYLISTAMELYMVNVEASRARVESAQVARTLLDHIAADSRAAHLHVPASGTSGGAGITSPGGPQSPGGPGASAGAATAGQTQAGGAVQGGPTMQGGVPSSTTGGFGAAAAGKLQALYGAVDQLRIDRPAYANWERFSREIEPTETSADPDMPMTVRYFFVDDNRLTAQKLAQQGVAKESSPTAAGGLYRETIPTSALNELDPPLPASDAIRPGARLELLAPEVVGLKVLYYDGTDLLEEWDPILEGGMPIGVEITLTIAEPRYRVRPDQDEQQRLADGRYLDSELIEYRRFVRLPMVAASPPAQLLLPTGGGQGGGPGQRGDNQGGQGQQGGPGGGQGGGQGGQPGAAVGG